MLSTKRTFNWKEVAELSGFPGGRTKLIGWLKDMNILDSNRFPEVYYFERGFINMTWLVNPHTGNTDIPYSWVTKIGLDFITQLVSFYFKQPDDNQSSSSEKK